MMIRQKKQCNTLERYWNMLNFLGRTFTAEGRQIEHLVQKKIVAENALAQQLRGSGWNLRARPPEDWRKLVEDFIQKYRTPERVDVCDAYIAAKQDLTRANYPTLMQPTEFWGLIKKHLRPIVQK